MKLRELFIRRGAPFVSLAILLWGPGCSDQTPAFDERIQTQESFINGDDGTRREGEGGSTSDSLPNGPGGAGGGGGTGGTIPKTDDGSGGAGGSAPTIESIQRTFNSTITERGKVIYDWATDRLEQLITMEHSRNEETITHQQKIRAQHTELFPQGSDESSKQETFNQNDMPSGLLDILVVVDNSPSMREEQVNLSTKLDPLLSYVQDSDWRIGVVTTDPGDGCMRGLINKGDADRAKAFQDAVTAGIKGTGTEQGVYQAVNALKCNGGSWLRNNSTLAILIVSDEDNCSNGTGCGAEEWGKASYLMNYLKSIRQVGVNAKIYGLVWHPSMTTQQCSTAINKAYTYGDLISQTGGTFGAICDEDYSSTLSSISQNISVILENQFALQFAPLAGSLKVYVNDQLMNGGYTITGNVLKFDAAPAAGSVIRVEYDYLTTPARSSFTLAKAADPDTINVYLDGNLVAKADYSYDPATSTVSFFSAPMGREIKVVYQQKDGLLTDFAINGPVDVSTVSVYVNSQRIASGDFSVLNDKNLIHFNSAPADGAVISISYIKNDRPRYEYPIFLTQSALQTLEVFDEVTMETVPYSLGNRSIIFPAEQFRAGRTIVIAYQKDNGSNHQVDVNHDVRVVLDVADEQGTLCDPIQVGMSGSVIDLTSCNFAAGDRVHILFAYVAFHTDTFTMDDPRLGNGDSVRWEVSVNNVPTTNYSRQGTTIMIPGLNYDSRVVIKATFGM